MVKLHFHPYAPNRTALFPIKTDKNVTDNTPG